MRTDYDAIGVTKSRVCALIAKSEEVRSAINYKGSDAEYYYDPEDYMTLIWNCIHPVLKDPDTITTAEPQILVGIESQPNGIDPDTVWLYGTINIVLDVGDLRTDVRYIRKDLLEDGVCAYTKADYIAYTIKKALASTESKTWLGDIQFIESTEGPSTKMSHYGRTVRFRVKEINTANRGV